MITANTLEHIDRISSDAEARGAAGERARLRDGIQALLEIEPLCDCGCRATCWGAYEGQGPEFMCDVCCGHWCEDGKCVSVWRHALDSMLALLEVKAP